MYNRIWAFESCVCEECLSPNLTLFVGLKIRHFQKVFTDPHFSYGLCAMLHTAVFPAMTQKGERSKKNLLSIFFVFTGFALPEFKVHPSHWPHLPISLALMLSMLPVLSDKCSLLLFL